MKLRTEVLFPESEYKIKEHDPIFSIGSCFSSEMTTLLANAQIQTLNNPFGTIFNPYSLNNALKRIQDLDLYTEHDLIEYKNQYISLDHHSDFTTSNLHKTLEKINGKIKEANSFLKQTKFVLITYGTAFIYEFLPKQKRVANCHKIPNKYFEKSLLSYEEIQELIESTLATIKKICGKDVQIIFTISPVRHTKDGMVENQRSKALLLSSLHQVIEGNLNTHYLPVYETMMDDLRDYRFYKEDMIHPTPQAIRYIFEKFGNSFFAESTMDFIEENSKIIKALEHNPSDKGSIPYKEFLEKLKSRISIQQSKVPYPIFKSYFTEND